ncbi:MAG: hypothetical protein RR293_02815 [Bacteroidales bacterium]
MKKILLSMLFCMAFVPCVMSQDVVYLNNGRAIKGEIIQNDNFIVKIRLADGEELQYKKVEVRTVMQNSDVVAPKEPQQSKFNDLSNNNKGWWCSAEAFGGGTLYSNTPSNMGFMEFSFVNGYRFNEFIKIGVGLGVRGYIGQSNDDQRSNISKMSFPVYLDVRGNFISQHSRMFSPYWSLDIGYSINDNFFFAPTLGMRIGGLRHSFLFGISYMGQILNKTEDGYKSSVYTDFICGRLAYEF